jgi:2-C-methyl-D-erythritol 4-phosphate cytidylyltransferase
VGLDVPDSAYSEVNMRRTAAIIVAAGMGRRFGSAKQFVSLKGKPVVEWCLEAFNAHPRVLDIVLVLPRAEMGESFSREFSKLRAVVEGGTERQDSVRNGLARVAMLGAETVLVHDGVRPLVSGELISRVIEAAEETGAAVPGLPVEETVKDVEGTQIRRTLERSSLVRVQTPQGFFYWILQEALEAARRDSFYGTDEAALVERLGRPVAVVPGDERNIKITTPLDLKTAEAFLGET